MDAYMLTGDIAEDMRRVHTYKLRSSTLIRKARCALLKSAAVKLHTVCSLSHSHSNRDEQSLPGRVLSPIVRCCVYTLSIQIKPHTKRSSADQRQQSHAPFGGQNPCEAACHDEPWPVRNEAFWSKRMGPVARNVIKWMLSWGWGCRRMQSSALKTVLRKQPSTPTGICAIQQREGNKAHCTA